MIEIYLNKSLESLPGEEWRPIPLPGYNHLFQVSNLGRLKKTHFKSKYPGNQSVTVKILAQNNKDRGYCKADLCTWNYKRSIKVHRMVALAFLAAAPEGYDQVNHKNGNKTDNRVENLEWCNNSINIKHAWATGLFKPKQYIGATNKLSTIIMHAEYGTFYSIQEAAKLENISRHSLSRMVQNKIANRTKYIAA